MLIHSTLNRMHTQLYFDVIMHERNTCLYSSCIFCINVHSLLLKVIVYIDTEVMFLHYFWICYSSSLCLQLFVFLLSFMLPESMDMGSVHQP